MQAFRHDVKYKICATLIHGKNSQTATPGPHGHQRDLQSHLLDHRRVLPIKLSQSLTLLFASTAGFQLCWGLIRHLISNIKCLKQTNKITASLVMDQIAHLGF